MHHIATFSNPLKPINNSLQTPQSKSPCVCKMTCLNGSFSSFILPKNERRISFVSGEAESSIHLKEEREVRKGRMESVVRVR